jgi:hypothetical protein
MRLLINKKAVSSFILIILILCATVFGALVSYLWVMGNYYNMPEDTTLLIVTNVIFPGPPATDLTYFNVTILNPSNSISDVNITAVRLSVEGKNEVYNITATDPEPLPSLIRRGTEHTFKCKKNWSDFAGETVRIEPVAVNASTKSYSYTTPRVKLNLTPHFDVTKSVEYFDLTIENMGSIVSITLSEIMLFGMSIKENITPSLPYSLPPNQSETFRCNYDWESLRKQNVTITVKSSEGYEKVYTTNELLGATLYIQEAKFDYTDVTYFNLTISNSEDSTASATINRINLTLQDGTTVVINNTSPPITTQSIFNTIRSNETKTFKCFWNWTQHRNETLTINAYALEGFTIPSKTTQTPPVVVWNITEVSFDLDDVEHFLVNVTNMQCSFHNITVTQIKLNTNPTSFTSETVPIGGWKQFNCSFYWTAFRGSTVTITVNASNVIRSQNVTLPYMLLRMVSANFSTTEKGKEFNVTIENIANSLLNASIARIVVRFENELVFQSEGIGYVVDVGKNVTLTFSWDWSKYKGKEVTISVYTVEGLEFVGKITV